MKIKEKHKDLKKKVTVAEKERNLKRGQKSWYDLRTLKKLKLKMKDELAKKLAGAFCCQVPRTLQHHSTINM